MKRSLLFGALMLGTTLSAQAHEIWIERDGAGPVRVYLAEPSQEGPDEEQAIKRVVSPALFGEQGKAGKLTREGDHLVAPLQGAGDAWLSDAKVFEPWKGQDGGFESVSYYARAGRTQTGARLDFEFVPSAAQSQSLTLQFRNKPLADTAVTVINASKWTKELKTDAKGGVTLPKLTPGRYIVVASHKEPVDVKIGSQQVTTMHHITTLTFVAN